MRHVRQDTNIAKERLVQGLALALLLLMVLWCVAGPSGLLAWGENQRLLEQREKQLVDLKLSRDHLKNRVALLNPERMDPDLAGELVRSQLNVVHPDEMVMQLP
ncbi:MULTISPECIES: FtsB family cell division protein [Novosphingobium]|uniref:Cell division protein FtsB n=1 Tax=Novosphingobium panipatense TaxID=428991 RepID=A0ABY1Q376_9SPHN|nr:MULTISPECIES: septum formation initiator family protein [Novosphingobium]SMP57291.1 Cell division protein FtsB [Novosphingobium panipatense]